jgi:hypothetical protein
MENTNVVRGPYYQRLVGIVVAKPKCPTIKNNCSFFIYTT